MYTTANEPLIREGFDEELCHRGIETLFVSKVADYLYILFNM